MLDGRVATQEAIAEALGTNQTQVRRWASVARPATPLERRYRDPLRLCQRHGVDLIRRSSLEAWRRRNLLGGAGERRVYGWADIRKAAELSRRAAMLACERLRDPLPVVRPAAGRVWAYLSAIEEWVDAQTLPSPLVAALRQREKNAAGARSTRGLKGRRRSESPKVARAA